MKEYDLKTTTDLTDVLAKLNACISSGDITVFDRAEAVYDAGMASNILKLYKNNKLICQIGPVTYSGDVRMYTSETEYVTATQTSHKHFVKLYVCKHGVVFGTNSNATGTGSGYIILGESNTGETFIMAKNTATSGQLNGMYCVAYGDSAQTAQTRNFATGSVTVPAVTTFSEIPSSCLAGSPNFSRNLYYAPFTSIAGYTGIVTHGDEDYLSLSGYIFIKDSE